MNAIVPTRGEDAIFLPVMQMEVAIDRRNHLVKFVQSIMKENVDFGKIPGAGDKPTLLKPGAEKLATFFGLTPVFVPIAVVEDWTGEEHKGEAFFYYRYRCELHRNGNLIASSEGSCNSWESKYRYRKAERVCPVCGQAAIIKGKAEYGGGWLCFKRKGGCDAKFQTGDAAIEKQEVGRVTNPDVADQVNTIQKMAQKRALIAAVLLAVNASEFFTQDIEDMVIEGEWSPVAEPVQQPKQQNAPRKAQNAQDARKGTNVPDNPFDDAAPYYARAWAQLTGKEYDLANWIQALHRKDEPASDKQYQFLTGLVDALTNDQHGYALSVLCQADINSANKPSRMAAKALLRHLQREINAVDENGNEVKDENGKVVKVANPEYRQDFADIITNITEAAQPQAEAA